VSKAHRHAIAPDLRSFGESTVILRDGTEEDHPLKSRDNPEAEPVIRSRPTADLLFSSGERPPDRQAKAGNGESGQTDAPYADRVQNE